MQGFGGAVVGVVVGYVLGKSLSPVQRAFFGPFLQVCKSLLAILCRFTEKPGCHEWGFVFSGGKRFLDLLENPISVLSAIYKRSARRPALKTRYLVDRTQRDKYFKFVKCESVPLAIRDDASGIWLQCVVYPDVQ